MNVYEVKYAVLWKTLETGLRRWEDQSEPVHVLANGDARTAIPKARRFALKKRFEWTTDNGMNQKRTNVAIGFRLIGVERVLTIDAR